MKKHIIFVMEGGGAKGPFEVGVLASVEERMGAMSADIADAFVATSIGAVNAGILAAKTLWAAELGEVMMEKLPHIFKKRLLRLPRYDRRRFVKLYEEVVERRLGKQALMGDIDASVHVIATATNMCDGVNHYFKSDKEDEKELPITEACCRSFAAPLYFGQLDDPAARAIWLDGGCGIENMPLWQAYVEAWRRGWFAPGHSAHILALGCGYAKYWIDYETGSRGGALRRTIRAVRYFNSITRGSLARNQSVAVQVRTMHALAQAQPNFTFDYAEWPGPMPRELDVMDNVKARRDYYRVGRQVGRQVDIARLRR